MILEYNIIFLDTNVFQSENFTEGKKLNQLLDQSIEEGIQVKIVDITYQECLKRIQENLIKAKTAFKKASALLNKEGNLLRQTEKYKQFYSIPKVEIESDFIELKNHFDSFLKEKNIEIISSEIANHNEVFKLYFDKKSPFGTGQKKDEFPDAFILNTIEHWCDINMSGAFVISSDNDMLSYVSKSFEVINGIGQMLNVFVNASNYYKAVYGILSSNLNLAIDELKESIDDYTDNFSILLYERLLSDPYYVELEYGLGEILNFEVSSLIITSLEENLVQMDIRAKVDLQLPLTYNDLSMAHYDSEDDRYWNVTHVSENSIYRLDLLLPAEFEFEIDEREVINFSLGTLYDYKLVGYEKIEENIQERSEFSDW
ncbi:PIN domain-containing protein [Winogradskyella sediminis]|uniref:PIN domain-containing protein n=1 Tax=Winogradskyella sediminis TaxID=1382466 RepID=UPI000E25F4ED|nr:PIN domain-containing protein [Winogradskyella sediminis]REG87875.1 hypothetical protein C8N41_102721 [Winogradskyella sediminis]